ncbi:MAG: hypothetical protein U0K37_07025 [Acutalibacteraceae bacterium]|nr:hypothetical protein [Acutalibacteraceae bacterium]
MIVRERPGSGKCRCRVLFCFLFAPDDSLQHRCIHRERGGIQFCRVVDDAVKYFLPFCIANRNDTTGLRKILMVPVQVAQSRESENMVPVLLRRLFEKAAKIGSACPSVGDLLVIGQSVAEPMRDRSSKRISTPLHG